jgi:hypothetical protein
VHDAIVLANRDVFARHEALLAQAKALFVVELLPLVVVEKPVALPVAAYPTVPWLLAGAGSA